jgi:arylsulfatase A-like enzyme
MNLTTIKDARIIKTLSNAPTQERFSMLLSRTSQISLFACLISLLPINAMAATADRPNILWISVEDMSADIGCYGDPYADTPRVDRLARQSVRFTHAFATAPVCSPVRSCLITGVYATSLGTQRLRSEFALPKDFRGFPELLRRAGYFTTNNVKTDYNIRDEASFIRATWDRNGTTAHWRQRKPGQPFFSVFNLMVTHQSRTSVWPTERFEREVAAKLSVERRHDPSLATIPPYFPDIPSVRKTLARYYDCISVMDDQVGEILDQLREDGLSDNTIVFFFSDHGRGLPRGKRVLHDTGLHVPLMVHFPERYRALAPSAPGSTTNRLVSFVDYAPSVLSLAGVAVPSHMQGQPFLGGKTIRSARKFVVGARDRVDEVFDVARSVRDHRFLYIRNYMPHLSWMPPERYSDSSTMRRDLKRMLKDGSLNETQLTYSSPRRSREELYDTNADPHQIRNLATSAEYQTILTEMRKRLADWQRTSGDLGFMTEPDVSVRFGNMAPITAARTLDRQLLNRIVSTAELVGDPTAVDQQLKLLTDPDRAVRYWAAIGLVASPHRAVTVTDSLKGALDDVAPEVSIEAATALLRLGNSDRALGVLTKHLESDPVEVVLHAMRSLELLGPAAKPATREIQQVLQRAATEETTAGAHACWMFVRFSAEAALSN